VSGEPTGDHHPAGPVRGRRVDTIGGPRHGSFDGDGRGADRVEVSDEPWEQPMVIVEVVAEQAAQTQILGGGIA
jgi:hypothetical protein